LKCNSLKELTDARAANIHFSAGKRRLPGKAMTLVAITALPCSPCVHLVPDLRRGGGLLPEARSTGTRTSFVLRGMAWARMSYSQYAFAGSKKIIKSVIDAKTNRLDEITGETAKTNIACYGRSENNYTGMQRKQPRDFARILYFYRGEKTLIYYAPANQVISTPRWIRNLSATLRLPQFWDLLQVLNFLFVAGAYPFVDFWIKAVGTLIIVYLSHVATELAKDSL
jgi:hypothetical protein